MRLVCRDARRGEELAAIMPAGRSVNRDQPRRREHVSNELKLMERAVDSSSSPARLSPGTSIDEFRQVIPGEVTRTREHDQCNGRFIRAFLRRPASQPSFLARQTVA
ncbi:MAG: hypothetical protein ABSE80_06500 [Halobacteriota archaeon]